MIGIFQFHNNLIGPQLYMWSIIDQNIVMQLMTIVQETGSFLRNGGVSVHINNFSYIDNINGS